MPIIRRGKGRKIPSRITDSQDRTIYEGTNTRMARAIWGVMLVKSGVVSPRWFPAWPFRRGRRVLANRLSGAKTVIPVNWRETGDVMITDIIATILCGLRAVTRSCRQNGTKSKNYTLVNR